jgi:trehalose-phosphatase
MRRLSVHRPAIRQRIVRARRVLLCCDVDGTLAPIAEHPARVCLSLRMRALLGRLAARPGLTLAFISGRRLADAKRLVGIRRAYYAGNHGLELNGPGIRGVDSAARAMRPVLRRVARVLGGQLRRVPGAWIEDKGLTLSLHVRQATPAVRVQAKRLFRRVVEPLQRTGQLCVTPGKMSWEVRPMSGCNKGTVIERLAAHHQATVRKELLVVCLGDDRTDEDAFRAVNRLRGISILVSTSARRTLAQYRLRDVNEVGRWLERLADSLDVGAGEAGPAPHPPGVRARGDC